MVKVEHNYQLKTNLGQKRFTLAVRELYSMQKTFSKNGKVSFYDRKTSNVYSAYASDDYDVTITVVRNNMKFTVFVLELSEKCSECSTSSVMEAVFNFMKNNLNAESNLVKPKDPQLKIKNRKAKASKPTPQ